MLLAVPACPRAIVGGSVDAGDPAVVAVLTEQGGTMGLCSGVLVSPRTVLTAAHCVDPTGGITVQAVVAGSGLADPGATLLPVSEVIIHPSWVSDPANGKNLALLRLATDPGVAPIPVRTEAAPAIGTTLRIVGFGLTDALGTEGVKRQVSTSLTGVYPPFIEFGDATANTCGGDSGGPVLVLDGDLEEVAAIVSLCAQSCSASSYASTLAADADWILGSEPPAPDPPGGGCGGCGHADGGLVALLAAVVAAAAFRRRGRGR